MPVLDNDQFFQATNMIETTSRPDLIYNEFKGRVVGTLGRVLLYGATIPPNNPTDQDSYIIGNNALGDWVGLDGLIAVWTNGWKYINPRDGHRVMVIEGTGEGRVLDRWLSNWSSIGGQQTLAPPVDTGGGNFEASWDLALGQLARLKLEEVAVTLTRPAGTRYGRPMYFIAEQDATGGRELHLKSGNFLVTDDTPHTASGLDIATGPDQETLIEFIWAGPQYVGPVVTAIHKNIQSV